MRQSYVSDSFLFIKLTQKCIKEFHDWYFVSTRQIAKYGGHSLLQRYYKGSLIRALQVMYPEHTWHSWRFSSKAHRNAGRTHFSKTQHLLFKLLQQVE